MAKISKFSKNFQTISSEEKPDGENSAPPQEKATDQKVKFLKLGKLIDDLSSIHSCYAAELGTFAPAEKAGRVLSSKNRELVSQAITALQALIDAAEPDKSVTGEAVQGLVSDAQSLQKLVEKVIQGAKTLK